jgi:DinB superfamily
METHERQLVLDQLAASQARLLELVDGLTPAQWTFHPAEGRWSIGDCLEHVIRVEDRILGVIGKKLAEGKPEPEKKDPAHAKDAVVTKGVPDRTVRREAPEPVRPTGQWPGADELLAEFRKTRQRTTDFAATTQSDLRSYFNPHGGFGELDFYQWLLVLSLHGSRHAQQIEEIKAAPGFPRPTASPASA